MTPSRRSVLLGAAGFAGAVSTPLFAASREVETAYVNGAIWTARPQKSPVTAFGVSAGRIVAVGAAEVSRRSTKKTRTVDLKGAFVAPGFVDSHVHMLMGSFGLTQVQLRSAASRQELSDAIGAYAKAQKGTAWITGGSWDHERWGGVLPDHTWIDAAAGDVPVAVQRLDGHMYLVNAVALRLAGIDSKTPDPPGGKIERFADGAPTGILKDGAKALVERVIPPPSFEQEDEALRAGIAQGLSRGVTQVHIMGMDWRDHDAFRRARSRGPTGMRFNSYVPLSDWERLDKLVRAEGRGDDWVRWGGLKGFADGSLGSSTALFHEPYADNHQGHGLAVTDASTLKTWVSAADRAGLQVAVHAIGDAANDLMLDIYAETVRANGRRDRRFRIEHAQHLSPSAVERFARQGVIASMQPYHLADDGGWAASRIGEARLHGAYAIRSLIKSGAHIAFGSDWPVAPLDPLGGVHAAVTRETLDGKNPKGWLPGEKITVDAALGGFTSGPAYAGFQDDRLGAIAPGMIADFVVLEQDLRTIDPDKIPGVKVMQTFVDGVARYTA